jgi:hypothetical protein
VHEPTGKFAGFEKYENLNTKVSDKTFSAIPLGLFKVEISASGIKFTSIWASKPYKNHNRNNLVICLQSA